MANKVGRPKKVKTESDQTNAQTPSNSVPLPSISPYSLEATSERWSRVFASSQNNGFNYLIAMQNALSSNPYVQNQRLKMLKSQPNLADRETLENAIQNPAFNELTIRQASWALASSNYPIYKMMKLPSDILTYKTYCYPKYASNTDMKTPRFLSDSKIVDMWLKKVSFKRDISKRENMKYGKKNDEYTCHNGKKLKPIGTTSRKSKSGYKAEITIYECENCSDCQHKSKCTKATGNRKMQVSKLFVEKRLRSLTNIMLPEGILLRMNRSIQVEGAFGVLKEDHGFRRFLTRGKDNVKIEFTLLSFGYNINKLHSKIQKDRCGLFLHPIKIA